MSKRQAVCLLIAAALFLSVAVWWRSTDDQSEEPISEPERNWNGLKVQQMAAQPEPEICFSEADVIAVARMLWGEARGCTLLNQQQAVWCVLNRVDDPRFPNTVMGVITQPHQFHGYSASFPATDELCEVARDVLTRWSREKQGETVERELAPGYVFFTGDGAQNHFRTTY